jgi:hypothetical protein
MRKPIAIQIVMSYMRFASARLVLRYIYLVGNGLGLSIV